jgi:hypothetical protein
MKVKVVRRASLGVAVMLAWAGMAQGQALDQLPGDSLVVVHINNLSKVGAKVADLSKKLGLNQISPEAVDPFGMLEQKMGVKAGINHDSDMAIAWVDTEVTKAGDDSFLVLIPVTDYKAFLSNFADAKTEGGITEMTTPDGKPAFAQEWGKYAAFSPSKETLLVDHKGVKVPGTLTPKELSEKDIVVFGNFAKLKAKLLPQIQKDRAEWLADLEKDVMSNGPAFDQGGDPNDPGAVDEAENKTKAMAKKFLPTIKVAANQGINIVEALVRDTTSASYSINITDAGINGTLQAEFDPNSYAGKLMSSIKGSDSTFLSGLPTGKYVFFGGWVIDSKSIVPAFEDLVAPVRKELTVVNDDDSKTLAKAIDAYKSLLGATSSITIGMLAPEGALMQEAILQQVQIAHGDSKAIQQAQMDMLQSQEQLMALFQGVGMGSTKTTFTPAARQIDGITFTQFKTEFAGDANSMEAAQARQMMSVMYGPDGMSGLFGPVDDKTLLTVSGLPAAKLSNAIKAAKANEDVLGKQANVNLTVKELPTNRIAAFYIPLDNILGTALNFAQQAGMPVQAQMAENLPPIGITLATVGPAVRMDGHLPMPLIKNISDVVMQIYTGMHGGPAGGPPAGGPPAGGPDNGPGGDAPPGGL